MHNSSTKAHAHIYISIVKWLITWKKTSKYVLTIMILCIISVTLEQKICVRVWNNTFVPEGSAKYVIQNKERKRIVRKRVKERREREKSCIG